MSIDNFRFPFVLDHKPGFLLGWFFYRIFKRFSYDAAMTEPLKRMHREGTVVYCIKYRGVLDFLLYNLRFRKGRLPYPKLAFDLSVFFLLPLGRVFKIARHYLGSFLRHGEFPSPYKTGFYRSALSQGTTSLLCLIDPQGFTRHFIYSKEEALGLIIQTQREMERPIYLVPLLVLYKITTEKERGSLWDILFGFKDNIGLLRKIVLFIRHKSHAFIDFGTPLNLKDYLQDNADNLSLEETVQDIRQTLTDRIDTQKRVILGPVMKSKQQLKEIVLRDQEILTGMERLSRGNPRALKKIRKDAEGYFDEIAADFSIGFVEFFNITLTWLWKKIFQGIDVDSSELAMVRQWARRGSLIYVPSHKSHIDYLVLNHTLLLNHMHIPRIAAGQNLAFWPMGYVFRKSGAFFIRRSFKGARLYARVFDRYIKALLEEGHPLEFFIEGGRSRSGKLILPKTGFLSILLQAYRDGYCKDLIFVPASISYDRLLEEESYLEELDGKEKQKETFWQFLGARKFLKRKYGHIYIRFGEPFSLKDYLGEKEAHGEELQREMAFHLVKSINKVTLVTPLSLVATAILIRHRRGFLMEEMRETSLILQRFLKRYSLPMAPNLGNIDRTLDEAMSLLSGWKMMSLLRDIDGEETFYFVEDEKKRELEYYKNSTIHYFISHSFTAAGLLRGTDEICSRASVEKDYLFLRRLFKSEFIYGDMSAENEIKQTLEYFEENRFIVKNEDGSGYKLTRLGLDRLPMWSAFVKTFIESYWVASRVILKWEQSTKKKGDILKAIQYQGLRFHKLGLIDHLESVSQLTFQNALRYIRSNVLASKSDKEEDPDMRIERLNDFSDTLHNILHRRL